MNGRKEPTVVYSTLKLQAVKEKRRSYIYIHAHSSSAIIHFSES